MSSNPSSARSGWRPEESSARKRPIGPRWRTDAQSAVPAARRRFRWGRIFLVAAFFLIFACLLVWVSLWLRPPEDTTLLVAGASYQDNLAVPANLYGWNGLKDLAELGRGDEGARHGGTLRLLGEPRELRLDEDWKASLRTFPGKTLLLCLSLHGGADAKGAYLLTPGAYLPRDPLSPEKDKIRIEELFDTLKAVPAEKNVLLVLDATQLVADWSLGMLNNDFARALEKLNRRIVDTPNLVVLSASAPDQRSWPSEEWNRTIFQHFLIEGLRGGADAANGTPADGRIDAAELFQFVQERVASWAAGNRDAEQTPVLFPRGQAGLDRARKIHLTVARDYRPADPATLKPFVPPSQLMEAWQRYVELRNEVPGPAVYAPHLWRLYQERLLRYEQLVQAGYHAAALSQAGHLRDLKQEIEQARRLDLGSIGNSLTMHAAAGFSLPPRETVLPWVNKLWEAPVEDRGKAWTEIRTLLLADTDRSPLLALIRLREMLLERAADAPRPDLHRECDLIRLTDDNLREDQRHPMPAEAHFLLMLRRDLPGWNSDDPARAPLRQRPDLLRRAIRVRLLAEKAAVGEQAKGTLFEKLLPGAGAPYSEQLLPWFRAELEQADALRRQGEDLLFATEPEALERADAFLSAAEKGYLRALEASLRARQGLAVRDQVVPMLPFYARWLGSRLPREEKGGLTRDLRRSLIALCREVHSLEELLSRPSIAKTPPGQEALRTLSTQADLVLRQFRELEGAAKAFRLNLEEVSLPSAWRDIDAALAMPFPDLATRKQLIESKSRIAQRLLVRAARATGGAASSHSHENPKEHARLLGSLALHLLGKRTFDELGKDLEIYDDVAFRLERFGLEERWWESLGVAAQQIGERWSRMPQAVDRALELSRKLGPDAARPGLSRADHLSRYMGVKGILALQGNAPRTYRLALAEDLLFNQARRAWLDHWADEDPAREPYYRDAGLRYLSDAQTLLEPAVLGPDPRLPKLRAELQKADSLQLTLASAPGWKADAGTKASASLHWTSEQQFPLRYRFEADLPAQGFAILWADVGPGLTLAAGPAPPHRLVRPIDSEADDLLDFTLALDDSATPVVRESSFTVQGLWRGHAFAGAAPIQIHRQAHTVVTEHPLPLKASVAVRAPRELHHQFGAASGAVAIVLDVSGSMGRIPGRPITEKTTYQEAVAALRTVLARLPRGATVSLWTFGQSIGNPDAAPEKTISRLLPPTSWDPDDPTQLDRLIRSLEALRPWNESPILRAMIQASQDLQDAEGFKTLLVLTDGLDNRFERDKELNPHKADIPASLRHYFPDIEVNIIGFRMQDPEEKARQQFAEVEKLPIPGNIYMVRETDRLVAILDRAFKQQLRYWVEREDGSPLPGASAGLDVSYNKAGDQWYPGGLAPGGYKVRVHTNRRLSRSIGLNRGDLLLLELDHLRVPGIAGEPLALTRPFYAKADFPWKPAKERGNWMLAALQNQRKDNGVEMLFSLERKDDPLASTLTQSVPYKTWFEVTPPLDVVNVLPASRWHYQPGYPAPAYSYSIPDWPVRPGSGALLKPTVRAWWSADRDPPAAALEKGHDFTDPRAIRDAVVVANDQEVVVESVAVENHWVDVRPADGTTDTQRQLRPCLVVRLATAPNNPVYVRVQGVNVAGAEHRFYTQAGKYTAIFWPVTRDEMVLALRGIEIVSLAAFKRSAEARNRMIELDALAEPQPTDERPIPAVNFQNAWPADVSLAPPPRSGFTPRRLHRPVPPLLHFLAVDSSCSSLLFASAFLLPSPRSGRTRNLSSSPRTPIWTMRVAGSSRYMAGSLNRRNATSLQLSSGCHCVLVFSRRPCYFDDCGLP